MRCDEESAYTPAGSRVLEIGFEGVRDRCLMYTREDDPAARYVPARERVTDVSTRASFSLAKKCIEKCEKEHPSCPKPNPSAILPDCVIDCEEPQNPKLVATGGSKHGLYLALSYVWGTEGQPKTETSNVETYTTRGIDIEILPQTIRDAIHVTHSLGHRYLWVDALCIIQDDDDDKKRQLGQMGRIYSVPRQLHNHQRGMRR